MPCGYRSARNRLRVSGVTFVAPDMADFASATAPGGSITAWLYRLFPDRVLAQFTAGIDDNARGVATADRPTADRLVESGTKRKSLSLRPLSPHSARAWAKPNCFRDLLTRIAQRRA